MPYLDDRPEMPPIVCLCGSTRFASTFHSQNFALTMAGKIVLSIGADMKTDAELFADQTPQELETIKQALDQLHRRKIDLANEVLFLNVNGYMGFSTLGEWVYALNQGKTVRFLHPDLVPVAAQVIMELYPTVRIIWEFESADIRLVGTAMLKSLPPWRDVWKILHDYEDAKQTLQRDWTVKGLL